MTTTAEAPETVDLTEVPGTIVSLDINMPALGLRKGDLLTVSDKPHFWQGEGWRLLMPVNTEGLTIPGPFGFKTDEFTIVPRPFQVGDRVRITKPDAYGHDDTTYPDFVGQTGTVTSIGDVDLGDNEVALTLRGDEYYLGYWREGAVELVQPAPEPEPEPEPLKVGDVVGDRIAELPWLSVVKHPTCHGVFIRKSNPGTPVDMVGWNGYSHPDVEGDSYFQECVIVDLGTAD